MTSDIEQPVAQLNLKGKEVKAMTDKTDSLVCLLQGLYRQVDGIKMLLGLPLTDYSKRMKEEGVDTKSRLSFGVPRVLIYYLSEELGFIERLLSEYVNKANGEIGQFSTDSGQILAQLYPDLAENDQREYRDKMVAEIVSDK